MSRLTGALTKKYTKKEFYPFLNVIKSLEERKNLTEKINTKPFFLYLDPTSYCNLECPFCPTGLRKSDRPSTNMSLSIFKHIIDEIGFWAMFKKVKTMGFTTALNIEYFNKLEIDKELKVISRNITINEDETEEIILTAKSLNRGC